MQSAHQTNLLSPALLLKLESFAILAGTTWLYSQQGGNWLMLVLLFLVPDLAMIGYFVNPHLGSIGYNIAHTYITPITFAVLALAGGWTLGIQLALIWVFHISADRLIGYGLKYTTTFKDTHLQRV